MSNNVFRSALKPSVHLLKSFDKTTFNFKHKALLSYIASKHNPTTPNNTSIPKISSLRHFCTKTNESSNVEPSSNPLDDKEFQSLLKDFAKDFGLQDEPSEILEDIKKSIDESKKDSSFSPSHKYEAGSTDQQVNRFGDVPVKSLENFKEFSDADAVVLPSYEELVSGQYSREGTFHIDQGYDFEMEKYPMTRGLTGVFDIGELVDVLRKEKLMDVTVITVPKEYHYTDFLVLATARSPRHSQAVSEFMKKLYKRKMSKGDPYICIEGDEVTSWKAMDMGNIVLHIFLEETRRYYDIESLWLLDSEFDTEGELKPDPMFEAIQEEMEFFNSLQKNSTEKKPDSTI